MQLQKATIRVVPPTPCLCISPSFDNQICRFLSVCSHQRPLTLTPIQSTLLPNVRFKALRRTTARLFQSVGFNNARICAVDIELNAPSKEFKESALSYCSLWWRENCGNISLNMHLLALYNDANRNTEYDVYLGMGNALRHTHTVTHARTHEHTHMHSHTSSQTADVYVHCFGSNLSYRCRAKIPPLRSTPGPKAERGSKIQDYAAMRTIAAR